MKSCREIKSRPIFGQGGFKASSRFPVLSPDTCTWGHCFTPQPHHFHSFIEKGLGLAALNPKKPYLHPRPSSLLPSRPHRNSLPLVQCLVVRSLLRVLHFDLVIVLGPFFFLKLSFNFYINQNCLNFYINHLIQFLYQSFDSVFINHLIQFS